MSYPSSEFSFSRELMGLIPSPGATWQARDLFHIVAGIKYAYFKTQLRGGAGGGNEISTFAYSNFNHKLPYHTDLVISLQGTLENLQKSFRMQIESHTWNSEGPPGVRL